MASFPVYERTVVPLVENFNNDNSSMIITTCSNHGFNWVFGEPSVEDLYYAKFENKYLSSIFDQTTSGFLWQIIENVLSDVRPTEEYNLSVIGIDQNGTHDLLKEAYASVFMPRSINDSNDPFALTLPGLTRRPFKSVRGFKILIAKALIRAIDNAKLQKHVIIEIRRYPLHLEKMHRYKTIAVSPFLSQSETFIKIRSEPPVFRIILLADEIGYPLPVEELAQEAARISTIVEGGKVRIAPTFATSLPLLLRFSLSAPCVYKIMLIMRSQSDVSNFNNERVNPIQSSPTLSGYPSPDKLDYQAINKTKLQRAIAELASALATLPRLKTPEQNRDKISSNTTSPVKSSTYGSRRPSSAANVKRQSSSALNSPSKIDQKDPNVGDDTKESKSGDNNETNTSIKASPLTPEGLTISSLEGNKDKNLKSPDDLENSGNKTEDIDLKDSWVENETLPMAVKDNNSPTLVHSATNDNDNNNDEHNNNTEINESEKSKKLEQERKQIDIAKHTENRPRNNKQISLKKPSFQEQNKEISSEENKVNNDADEQDSLDKPMTIEELKEKLRKSREELEALRISNEKKETRNNNLNTEELKMAVEKMREQLMDQEDKIAVAELTLKESTRMQKTAISTAKNIISTINDSIRSSTGIDVEKLPEAIRRKVNDILALKDRNINGDEAMSVLSDSAYGFAVAVHIFCAEKTE